MTASSHAAIGTVIAAKIANPMLAIPLALASHILADYFPHWDAGTHRPDKNKKRLAFEGATDEILGFVIAYTLIAVFFPQTSLIYAFIIIVAAQLFDHLSIPTYMFNWNFPPFSWTQKMQTKVNKTQDKPWGIINQVAVVVGLIIAAVKF